VKNSNDRLLQVRAAAAILNCSHRTLENPNSSVRRALEELGAVVHIGRLMRIKESGVRVLVEHGAAHVRANPVKRKEQARRRKAGEQPEAA
jgi:hypothetical protein